MQGLDLVSSYLVWLHVEELEGTFDWSGNKNLTEFLLAAQRAGLLVALRIGPWCHGEVRNGMYVTDISLKYTTFIRAARDRSCHLECHVQFATGFSSLRSLPIAGGFPNWLEAKGIPLRKNSSEFLALVKPWYAGIAAHMQGLTWAEGGPVISVQIDNETDDVSYLEVCGMRSVRSTSIRRIWRHDVFTLTAQRNAHHIYNAPISCTTTTGAPSTRYIRWHVPFFLYKDGMAITQRPYPCWFAGAALWRYVRMHGGIAHAPELC